MMGRIVARGTEVTQQGCTEAEVLGGHTWSRGICVVLIVSNGKILRREHVHKIAIISKQLPPRLSQNNPPPLIWSI